MSSPIKPSATPPTGPEEPKPEHPYEGDYRPPTPQLFHPHAADPKIRVEPLQVAFLHKLADALNTTLDLNTLMHRVADLVRAVIDYRIFAILLINERAGIVNLGAEGMMLVAAIAGFATAVQTGSDWLAFGAGALSGAILAGDLYSVPAADMRGGFGDVAPVWRAFADRFSWVTGVGCSRCATASRPTRAAEANTSPAWIRPAKASALPWPKRCSWSGGSAA